MNINSIIMKIYSFKEHVVDSGFFRDVKEFLTTIAQPQNGQNIVLLKDITDKVIEHLNKLVEYDLQDILEQLLPEEDSGLLNPSELIISLTELIDDTQVNTEQYHGRLTEILQALINTIESNKQEIDNLYEVLLPYYEKGKKISDKAIMSFIFRDTNTISSLKTFYKVLDRWNKALYIYHQLVSSASPEDVELVNIQEGTLDVLLNFNIDVAINLTEIVKYGCLAFNGYLLYKAKVHEIVETYFGNKALMKSEEEREKALLKNIGITIEKKLLEQHQSLLKKDKGINIESIEKKLKGYQRCCPNIL